MKRYTINNDNDYGVTNGDIKWLHFRLQLPFEQISGLQGANSDSLSTFFFVSVLTQMIKTAVSKALFNNKLKCLEK